MGLIDDLAKKAGNLFSGAGDSRSRLIAAVLQIIQGKMGGLEGLVQAFQQNGLGDLISSWTGSGQNKPIAPNQVRQVFGQGNIREMAQAAGESEEGVLSQLTGLLPSVIDKLTPGGKMPTGDLLSQGLDLLKKKVL